LAVLFVKSIATWFNDAATYIKMGKAVFSAELWGSAILPITC